MKLPSSMTQLSSKRFFERLMNSSILCAVSFLRFLRVLKVGQRVTSRSRGPPPLPTVAPFKMNYPHPFPNPPLITSFMRWSSPFLPSSFSWEHWNSSTEMSPASFANPASSSEATVLHHTLFSFSVLESTRQGSILGAGDGRFRETVLMRSI